MTYSLSGQLLVASSLVTDPIYAGGVCLVMHQDENHTIGVMLNRPLQPTPEALSALLGEKKPRPSRLDSDTLPSPSDDDSPWETPSSAPDSATPANATPDSATPDSATPDNAIPDSASSGRAPPDSPSANGLQVLGGGGGKLSPWRMIHFGGPLSGPVLAIHLESQFAEAETGSGIYVAAQKQHLENLLRQEAVPYRLIVGHLGWQSGQIDDEIDAGFWHVIPATVESVFSPAGEMWPRLIRRATSSSLAKWIGVPDHIDAFELN